MSNFEVKSESTSGAPTIIFQFKVKRAIGLAELEAERRLKSSG